MGVSITAYTNLRKRSDVIAGEDEPIDPLTRKAVPNLWRAYVNPDFPGRAEGIENRAYYEYDQAISALDHSYGSYNIWRNELAKLAGWPEVPHEKFSEKRSHAASAWAAESGPFWELINFADNEGVISGPAAAKIARDFAEYQAHADAHHWQWFRDSYAGMRRAFEAVAASGGAVDYS